MDHLSPGLLFVGGAVIGVACFAIGRALRAATEQITAILADLNNHPANRTRRNPQRKEDTP